MLTLWRLSATSCEGGALCRRCAEEAGGAARRSGGVLICAQDGPWAGLWVPGSRRKSARRSQAIRQPQLQVQAGQPLQRGLPGGCCL